MSEHVDEAGVLRRRLPWEGAPYPLGRHVVHDPRSRAYRADTTAGVQRNVVHAHYGPVLNQGNLVAQGIILPGRPKDLGSCTGNGGAQNLNSAPLHLPREHIYTEQDAVDFYAAATQLDPWPGSWPPDDTGSSGLAVGAVLKARGLISRYEWGFGVDDALTLAASSVLSVGTEWLDGMFEPDDQGWLHVTGTVAGGHQYTVRGVNWRNESVLVLNSWGPDWGGWVDRGRRVYAGHARMRFADFGELLARQGDVIRYVR